MTTTYAKNYEKNFWIAMKIAMSARRGQVTAAVVRPISEKGDTVILKDDGYDTGFE